GPQTWQSMNVSNVLLDAGPQVLTLVMDTNGPTGSVANFNYLQAIVTRSNVAPVASLISPPNQSTFSAPANLTLRAMASDSDGTISKVDFFASGFLIGTATLAPYQVSWPNVAAGNYLITARATDNIGNTTTSAPRTIQVIDGEAPFNGVPLNVPGT